MADVLSQNEIDALLNALSDGQVDAEEIKSTEQKRIRVYDFKRPNKFSKDQIRSLENIYENYCRSLTTYFSAHLHTVIDVKVMSIEQITYDEFIRSMPNPTILGIFEMMPLMGNNLIEMSPSIAFAIVERLLGGLGQATERNRDLTEIEKTIIGQRLSQIIEMTAEAWEEVGQFTPQLVGMETNPQFTQILPPNEMVVLATLEITIGNTTGMINVCLSYLTLEPILDKLSTMFMFSMQSKKKSSQQVAVIRKNIEHARVEMSICLGKSEIYVKDLLGLTRGDVIPLNQLVKEPLPIYVGSFEKFKGVPGLQGEHLAIKLTEIIMEGRD